MNKKYLLIAPILLGVTTSCGCMADFRQDLSEFIRPIRFDKTYPHVNKALLTATRKATSIDEKEVLGEEEVYFFIDKTDKENLFYHIKLNRTGILKSNENDPDYIENKFYKEGETYTHYAKKGEEITTNATTEDYILKQMDKFFFLSETNGLHSNGMFYGDELQQMVGIQNFLEVDSESNTLKIEVNDLNLDGVKTFYTLIIDSYGMLLTGDYDMSDDSKRLIIDVDCKYNADAIYVN